MKTKSRPRMVWHISLILFVGFGISCLAQAQPGPRASCMYNPATEVTVKGTVEAVNQMTGKRGLAGTHLQLKTDSGTFDVHVGPSWFLAENQMSFAKGDQVEVIGSKVQFVTNTDSLLAREIRRGDRPLTLRDKSGFPVWSRRGRS